jgi:hypothetical protein
MSSVDTNVSGNAVRSPASPQGHPEGYAYCPEDSFWFRPSYTQGICPLCGEVAPGGAHPLPLLRRIDRSMLGVAGLALESVGMLVLVLFMYFKG